MGEHMVDAVVVIVARFPVEHVAGLSPVCLAPCTVFLCFFVLDSDTFPDPVELHRVATKTFYEHFPASLHYARLLGNWRLEFWN